MGTVALLAAAALAGGCAVYATPADVGVAVVPPPVYVGPPVVVRPYGYWGHYGYGGYGGYGGYYRPPYYPPRYGPPPRFYRR
ncbi:MAG: hypothetical protein ABWZ78_06760 [Burkholderiaceae bacterium]